MKEEEFDIVPQLKAADDLKRREIICSCVERSIRKILGLRPDEHIDFDTGFVDLGLDSVAAVQLSKKLNETFSDLIEVASTDIFDYPSVNELSDYIDAKVGGIEPNKKTPESSTQGLQDVDILSDEDVLKELDSHLDKDS
jgi:polyketide synthase 12